VAEGRFDSPDQQHCRVSYFQPSCQLGLPVIHDLKEDPIGEMAGNKKHDNVVDQGCQTFPLPPRMDWTSPFQRFVKQK
jgi:hypothetical protein